MAHHSLLQAYLQSNANLPHALLLNGHAETLLPALQQDLQYLLCENREPAFRGRDQCPSCHLYHSEAGHPDLLLIRPEGKLNLIKIDAVRDVIAFLNKSPLRGGMRIVVFIQADTLNIAAQNALLKSLEEPGPKTLIILLSDQPHLLLPTIKSRCQHLNLGTQALSVHTELAEQLLMTFDPLALTSQFAQLDPLSQIYTQMQLLQDLALLKFGSPVLTFKSLSSKLEFRAAALSLQKLWQTYQILIDKSALLQKKVSINPELCLFELNQTWQKNILMTGA